MKSISGYAITFALLLLIALPFTSQAAPIVGGTPSLQESSSPDLSPEFGKIVLLASGGPTKGKICGVSVVSPYTRVTDRWTQDVAGMSAEWVSILPYAFSTQGDPEVDFDLKRQFWGEQFEGMRELVQQAHKNGLKVMLKPMVWVEGGWVGGFDFRKESDWLEWEANYRAYIMETARVAAEEKVEMLCVGTEFKIASAKREKFWRQLIRDIKKSYSGAITYAANWDEFTQVRFWDQVDYIGLDAYFPLVVAKTPKVQSMKKSWNQPHKQIQLLNKIYGKPILFTEFGYRSINNCSWRQWEIQDVPFDKFVNLQAQSNAYQAFFEQFWEEDWFAGVFIWQWYTNDARAGGENNSDYTPQNKPAEELIQSWFNRQL